MNYFKAKKKAKEMKKITNTEMYVIKLKVNRKWYLPFTWFSFSRYFDVNEDYIINNKYKGKQYYSTKT